MGIKSMRFLNMEGDTIVVSFSGDNVAQGELIPAESPVILQMDGGGGEYKAVKYTTASISIVCDGLQHLDLYTAEPLAVKVLAYNDTTDTTLFSGYVSPNTFNQTITGVNDTLTIECVDCLGIAKFVPYRRSISEEGFRLITLSELLLSMGTSLNVNKILLSDFISIKSGDEQRETSIYQALELSESYFFSSSTLPQTLPDGNSSFDPLAVTIYDILSAVAESFRATWVAC